MIIAVEGPSAAGKTTWCQASGATFVPEYQPTGSEPDGEDLTAQATYWVDVNSGRWAAAERIEATAGIAICDSDPLKLHYSWCLARIGAGSIERFEHELSAVRRAFRRRSLGFADCVFVSVPSASQLKVHKQNDPTRRRRHFELHAALSDSLTEWYSAIDLLDPGRVMWEFPSQLDQGVFASPRADRSDVRFLEAVIDELPDLRR